MRLRSRACRVGQESPREVDLAIDNLHPHFNVLVEVEFGGTIIGKNRRLDFLMIREADQRALDLGCKRVVHIDKSGTRLPRPRRVSRALVLRRVRSAGPCASTGSTGTKTCSELGRSTGKHPTASNAAIHVRRIQVPHSKQNARGGWDARRPPFLDFIGAWLTSPDLRRPQGCGSGRQD